jgi:hypothetical protein
LNLQADSVLGYIGSVGGGRGGRVAETGLLSLIGGRDGRAFGLAVSDDTGVGNGLDGGTMANGAIRLG